MNLLFLICTLIMTVKAVVSKRVTALIDSFLLQSLCLCLMVLSVAVSLRITELYVIAFLMLLLKVIAIPIFLYWMTRKIKIDENAGLFLNPLISLLVTGLLAWFSYGLSMRLLSHENPVKVFSFAVSLLVMFDGMFIMIFRMKAIAQVIGLLIMENGLFICAVSLCGSMPFLVEIAIFFDVFVCVMVMGVFIYRINELFTHIDVSRLTSLKG